MRELDEKMKAAGMISIADLMAGTPMDMWHTHTGVHDIESFSNWLDMKYEEMLRLKATVMLSDEGENHELFEWALAHVGVLNAVRCNLRAALKEKEVDGLKPCPFCGEVPKLPHGNGTQYEIECDCGMARSGVQISDLMTYEERMGDDFVNYRYKEEFVERARDEAISNWNARIKG